MMARGAITNNEGRHQLTGVFTPAEAQGERSVATEGIQG